MLKGQWDWMGVIKGEGDGSCLGRGEVTTAAVAEAASSPLEVVTGWSGGAIASCSGSVLMTASAGFTGAGEGDVGWAGEGPISAGASAGGLEAASTSTPEAVSVSVSDSGAGGGAGVGVGVDAGAEGGAEMGTGAGAGGGGGGEGDGGGDSSTGKTGK